MPRTATIWYSACNKAPKRRKYREENMTKAIRTPALSLPSRRGFIAGTGAGLAGIIATGRAPAFAQGAAPKKLVFAHVNPEPESSAVAFAAMAKEVTERSKGELAMEFHGGTLLTKELEIINAVKSGNIAIGDPGRRRRDRVPGDGRLPGALSGRQLRPGLQDVQRHDRRPARQAVPGEIQAQGAVSSSITASAISGTASGRSPSRRICAA